MLSHFVNLPVNIYIRELCDYTFEPLPGETVTMDGFAEHYTPLWDSCRWRRIPEKARFSGSFNSVLCKIRCFHVYGLRRCAKQNLIIPAIIADPT